MADAAPAYSKPLFYQTVRPLHSGVDQNLKLARAPSFSFAAGSNIIPLLAEEFPLAASYYPTAFLQSNPVSAVAVTGLNTNVNLFVDEAGQWQNGAYLPAYIRRYPFILGDDTANKQLVLCVDDKSDRLGNTGELALFENGKPTDFTLQTMQFCQNFQAQGKLTDEFVAALQEQKLLETRPSINLLEGSTLNVSGLMFVDPAKFTKLPENLVKEWWTKGWLGLVYAHLNSYYRWQVLIELAKARNSTGSSNSNGQTPANSSTAPASRAKRA